MKAADWAPAFSSTETIPLLPERRTRPSDFDRTHVLTISYVYQISDSKMRPDWSTRWRTAGAFRASRWPRAASRSASSISRERPPAFSSAADDFITNPILPLAPGVSPKQATQGGTDNSFTSGPRRSPGSVYQSERLLHPVPQPGPKWSSALRSYYRGNDHLRHSGNRLRVKRPQYLPLSISDAVRFLGFQELQGHGARRPEIPSRRVQHFQPSELRCPERQF